jgi:hypothetical protein
MLEVKAEVGAGVRMIESERDPPTHAPGEMPQLVCGCGRHRELGWSPVIHVCSGCGRASDADGVWVAAESFVARHPHLLVECVELLCLDCRDRFSRVGREMP